LIPIQLATFGRLGALGGIAGYGEIPTRRLSERVRRTFVGLARN
jgi:hypothetical protein